MTSCMNWSTKHNVLSYPHTPRESQSFNRRWTAHRSFISVWMRKFGELSHYWQAEIVAPFLDHTDDDIDQLHYSDAEIVDYYKDNYPHLSPEDYRQPTFRFKWLICAAARNWRKLNDVVKKGFEKRAKILNSRPVVGVINEVNANFHLTAADIVSIDFRRFAIDFKKKLCHRRLLLRKEVLIGSKEVDISAKVYIKDMYIPAGVK